MFNNVQLALYTCSRLVCLKPLTRALSRIKLSVESFYCANFSEVE